MIKSPQGYADFGTLIDFDFYHEKGTIKNSFGYYFAIFASFNSSSLIRLQT